MTKLLYQASNSKHGESPFDRAIMMVANSNHIKISSPYIGLSYLDRLTSISSSWQLVTDIEAWLSSISYRERARACSFIQDHIDHIHHYADLHAKTVVGQGLAYTGSANLTFSGILNRTEVGVLLDDILLVNELHEWFDNIWIQTSSPKIDEVVSFSNWLNDSKKINQNGTKIRIESTGVKIKSQLINPQEIPNKKIYKDAEYYGVVDFTVEELVAAHLGKIESEAFTFSEYKNLIHQYKPSATVRDLFLEMLKYCLNLPRSVFLASKGRGFLYMNGRFHRGTKIQEKDALLKYDNFLAAHINALSFHESQDLPSNILVARLTGIGVVDQKALINSLIYRELIINDNNRYSMNESFEWPVDFNKFEKSKSYWMERLKEERLKKFIDVDGKFLMKNEIKSEKIDQIYLKFSEFLNKNMGVVNSGNSSELLFLISKECNISIVDAESIVGVGVGFDLSPYTIEFVSSPTPQCKINLNLDAEMKDLPLTSAYISKSIESKNGFFYNYVIKMEGKSKSNSCNKDEELEMISLYKNGAAIEDLAKFFGRSYKSVISKLARKGVYKNSETRS